MNTTGQKLSCKICEKITFFYDLDYPVCLDCKEEFNLNETSEDIESLNDSSDDEELEDFFVETKKSKLDFFKKERIEQFNTAIEIHNAIHSGKKVITIGAEEKSGKRIITEITYLKDLENINFKHIYIVNLQRNDIKPQLREMSDMGLEAGIFRGKEKKRLLEEIKGWLDRKLNVIIHLDECDYGSGAKQSLKDLIDIVNKNKRATLVNYSATPEEVLFSNVYNNVNRKDHTSINFKPNKKYRGSKWFLNNKITRKGKYVCIIEKPKPFIKFDKLFEKNKIKFTNQGLHILKYDINKTDRNIGILRISKRYNNTSKYAKFKEIVKKQKNQKKFDKKRINFIFIDSEEKICWEDDLEIGKKCLKGYKNIFVINQTCTRSTELGYFIMNHLGFAHDENMVVRKGGNFNTDSQRLGRYKHYSEKKDSRDGKYKPVNFKAKLYIDINVYKANQDDDFKNNLSINMSSRTKRNNFKDNNVIINNKVFQNKQDAINYLNDEIRYTDDNKLIDRKKLKDKEYMKKIKTGKLKGEFNIVHKSKITLINRKPKEKYTKKIKLPLNVLVPISKLNNNHILTYDFITKDNKMGAIDKNIKRRLYPCYKNNGELWYIAKWFVKEEKIKRKHKTKNTSIHNNY